MRRLATLGILVGIAAGALAPPASAEEATWESSTPIVFSGANESVSGWPSPTSVQVSGQEGPITDVDLHVNDIDFNQLLELNLLLVAPSGETEIVKRAGCANTGAVTNLDLTVDQQAAQALISDCPAGTYRPADTCAGGSSCPFEQDVPGGPHSVNFNNFNNENANGQWRLYSYRWCSNTCPSSGDRIESWSLDISTGSVNLDLPAGSATSGAASPYPSERVVTNQSGIVTDLNVRIDGIFHNHPDDIEIMLQKVGGPTVVLMSDTCGSFDVNAYGWTWDDEAAGAMPAGDGSNVCANPSYRVTNRNPGDSLPAPAPQAASATSLSAFDLLGANGIYRLWVADDSGGDEGFFTSQFNLEFTTRPYASTAFTQSALEVAEGEAGTLTVRRSGASSYAPGNVDVRTTAGTAGADDFPAIVQSLNFAANETEKTVDVSALADELAEDAETFTVSISGPSGDAAIGSPSSVTVTIPANEAPPPPPPPPPPDPLPLPPPAQDPTPEPDSPLPPEGDGASTIHSPDTVPPETLIGKRPKRATESTRARIKFSSNELGSSFVCKLDRAPYSPCTSPAKLKRLTPGRHKLRIRAIDAAGNADTTPAKAKWKVN